MAETNAIYRGGATSITFGANVPTSPFDPLRRIWRMIPTAGGLTYALPSLDLRELPNGIWLLQFANFSGNSFSLVDQDGLSQSFPVGVAKIAIVSNYFAAPGGGSPVLNRRWLATIFSNAT